VAALKNLKDKVQSEIQKYRGVAATARPQRPPHTNDFARLARRICGKSIGVVLGGGGARGLSHLVSVRCVRSMTAFLIGMSRECFARWKSMTYQ
jgi:lysophospholipid hydrolase